MAEITVEESKKIQLDMLLVIDRYCKDNNIDYSLACGTLIGAIRHKGYIPWDDDIDLYMTRSNYNKFISMFPESLDGCYIMSLERNSKWNKPYAKICDNRTLLIENTKHIIDGMGLGIDLFPIDEVPDEVGMWNSYNRRRKLLMLFHSAKFVKWRAGRSIAKNLFLHFTKMILYPISPRKLAIVIDNFCQKYNNQGFHSLFENCQGPWGGPFLKTDMDAYVDIDFEHLKFRAMKGYDDYLHAVYGNYMELPPIEKRVSHHAYSAYWK